jgi:hypothetical protein
LYEFTNREEISWAVLILGWLTINIKGKKCHEEEKLCKKDFVEFEDGDWNHAPHQYFSLQRLSESSFREESFQINGQHLQTDGTLLLLSPYGSSLIQRSKFSQIPLDVWRDMVHLPLAVSFVGTSTAPPRPQLIVVVV